MHAKPNCACKILPLDFFFFRTATIINGTDIRSKTKAPAVTIITKKHKRKVRGIRIKFGSHNDCCIKKKTDIRLIKSYVDMMTICQTFHFLFWQDVRCEMFTCVRWERKGFRKRWTDQLRRSDGLCFCWTDSFPMYLQLKMSWLLKPQWLFLKVKRKEQPEFGYYIYTLAHSSENCIKELSSRLTSI